MRKHSRCVLLAIIFVICCFACSTSAYNRLGTGEISGGAQGILYYRDSSINEYAQSVDYGISYWNGHTGNVSVSRTTTQSSSRCDIYWGDYFTDDNIIARTELILNNIPVTNYNADWYWCRIYFNMDVYNYDNMTYFNRKGTACHEYGHYLGLAHTSTTTSVMCQLSAGRTVNCPSQDDVQGIQAIYN